MIISALRFSVVIFGNTVTFTVPLPSSPSAGSIRYHSAWTGSAGTTLHAFVAENRSSHKPPIAGNSLTDGVPGARVMASGSDGNGACSPSGLHAVTMKTKRRSIGHLFMAIQCYSTATPAPVAGRNAPQRKQTAPQPRLLCRANVADEFAPTWQDHPQNSVLLAQSFSCSNSERKDTGRGIRGSFRPISKNRHSVRLHSIWGFTIPTSPLLDIL